MKIYFNTKAFDMLPEKKLLDVANEETEAEIAVLGAKSIDFTKCQKLKAIYRFGVGSENIPAEVLAKGIPKVYFPSNAVKNILYESTANFTVYLIFQMFYYPTIGIIDTWRKYTRDFFKNKNLLIIGLGNIGKRVAQKMKLFLHVNIYDILLNQPSDLKSLMTTPDIISLHIPLSEQTRNFIDAEKLSWMKDKAILINTARAGLVNEEALYQKLINSNLRAAFDIFWQEPYKGKLKDLGPEKFFMTPHTASQTIDCVRAGFNDILNIIKEFGG